MPGAHIRSVHALVDLFQNLYLVLVLDLAQQVPDLLELFCATVHVAADLAFDEFVLVFDLYFLDLGDQFQLLDLVEVVEVELFV